MSPRSTLAAATAGTSSAAFALSAQRENVKTTPRRNAAERRGNTRRRGICISEDVSIPVERESRTRAFIDAASARYLGGKPGDVPSTPGARDSRGISAEAWLN